MHQKLKTMKVSELMVEPVICARSDTSAHDILDKLNSSQISAIPVIDSNAVIGIVTIGDILKLFLQGKNLHSAIASEFMTKNIITAEQDSLVPSVIRGFLDNQVHHLPVTHQGKLVGIVTRRDLLKIVADADPEFALIP